MERNDLQNRLRGVSLIFALLFILVRTVVGFWLNVPSSTPEADLPPAFSSEWWSSFWVEAVGGVVVGVLLAILGALLKAFLPHVSHIGRVILTTPAIIDSLEKIQSVKERGLSQVSRIWCFLLRQTTPAISDSLQKIQSIIERSLSQVLHIGRFILESLAAFLNKLTTPKWYHEMGAIDPGLIEVCLAVTAVLVALPSFVVHQGTQPARIAGLKIFRFLSQAIPTLTSVKLLNLYAKGKGSRSLHILLSPIEDGPFFYLGWTIVTGVIVIAIVTFR